MTGSQAQWKPILEGERAEHANRAVEAILAGLTGRPVSGGSLSGQAGLAILHGHVAMARQSEEHAGIAEEHMDGAIGWLSEQVTSSSLYSGYTGVAWTMECLRRRLWTASNDEGDDPNEDIDLALRDELQQSPWEAPYDLIQGLAGLGMYALERLPSPTAAECLTLIIERLTELSEPYEGGIRWLTPVHHLVVRKTMERFPNGYYNLGVAHGVPGIIPVLAGAINANVAVDRARPLLEGAVRWIVSEKLPEGRSLYPTMVTPNMPKHPSRHAWCYGDPGIATALLVAADALDNDAWRKEAIAAGLKTARCALEHAGVIDPGICHGSAGLAHIFNRLYQGTGEAEFLAAANTWFDRTFAYEKADKGIGGYQAMLPVDMESGVLEWKDDPSFLTGVVGIALTFLAGTTSVEPTWDRILAVSAPGKSAA